MDLMNVIGLSLIVLLVLVLPLSVHKIEDNLEPFLLVMGAGAVTVSGAWSFDLAHEALKEPVLISLAVLVLGFAFKYTERNFRFVMLKLARGAGLKVTIFLLVVLLGILSSLITAIIAAIMLAEAITALGLKEDARIRVAVLACFAIGMGAVLTPVGEPLSTITVAKLKGAPHYADFFYLFKKLAAWIIPGIIFTGLWAARVKQKRASVSKQTRETESAAGIIVRGVKVYFFIAALVLLGAGLKPLAEITILKLSAPVIYWVNSISAVLDNATLAAIQIVPGMSASTIVFLLMGLILAGGLLVPGNIPNIISASKLGIKSKAWAKQAIPFGLFLMIVYFILMMGALPHG
ncbi:MAG: DUF1646 domain-containing protein [Elusimicrobium sp.]|jgi:predicted cation transporter|nr:DUF1646 domain-containing protein [Elusimicrobium sp.]